MLRDKLNTLIKDKNERLERDALRSAEEIIDSITQEQERIRKANERIAELRAALKELSVKQLDVTNILGE